MALRTNIEDIGVRIDPISFTADISVLWGNTTQTGNGLANGYMPDRSDGVPCKILPIVEVADPEGFMNGRQPLANCYWYEGSPLADDSNMITAVTPGYEIVTDGPKKYMLIVKKNFPVNSSQIIHAKFTILDFRTDTYVVIERQITFHTVAFDEHMLHMELTDCPAVLTIDQFDEADCGETPWNHTLSAQLFQGMMSYDDVQTAYKWQIFDDGLLAYRDFTADEKSVFVKGADTKSLTFDARFVKSNSFRCTALPKDRDWKNALYSYVSVETRIAETLHAEIVCTKGLRIGPRMNEEVTYQCNLSYNKGKVADDKYGLFRIVWKAIDDSVGAVTKILGEGRTMTFIPSDYGFDCKHYTSVYAEVQLRTNTAIVVNKDSKVITSSDKILVTNIYK